MVFGIFGTLYSVYGIHGPLYRLHCLHCACRKTVWPSKFHSRFDTILFSLYIFSGIAFAFALLCFCCVCVLIYLFIILSILFIYHLARPSIYLFVRTYIRPSSPHAAIFFTFKVYNQVFFLKLYFSFHSTFRYFSHNV